MSSHRDFDVVVVGGGHNGLTAAAQLAASGVRVCVVERRSELGGMASSVEVWPGTEVDRGAEDLGLFRSDLIDRLGLEDPALEDQALGNQRLELIDAPAFACAPASRDRPSLVLWSDAARAVNSLETVSKADARGLPDFLRTIERLGGELEDMLRRPPTVEALGSLMQSPELARFLTAPAATLVAEWFESESLRTMLCALAVFGHGFGPRSQGTGALLLYQLAGTTALGLRPVRWAKGGSRALYSALEASAAKHGAVVRCNAGVERILVERSQGEAIRAVGVRLDGGEELRAELVLSNLDLESTLFTLVGAEHLELGIVRRVSSLQYRGAVSRMVVEIEGSLTPPQGLDTEAMSGRMLVADDVASIERAADAVKYGDWSKSPVLDVKVPSFSGSAKSTAESDSTILTINAQYAPYRLATGTWAERRGDWAKTILEQLQAAWPELEGRVGRHRLWTPLDFEQETGATEGSPMHGEMSLGQMLVHRPLPGMRGYGTSVGRLLLCGAGAHPGGGVTGLPGARAADQALELLA